MKNKKPAPTTNTVIMTRSEWFLFDATTAALGFCLVESARFLGKKAVKAMRENREAKVTEQPVAKKKKAG